jgi:hypothetical protein
MRQKQYFALGSHLAGEKKSDEWKHTPSKKTMISVRVNREIEPRDLDVIGTTVRDQHAALDRTIHARNLLYFSLASFKS